VETTVYARCYARTLASTTTKSALHCFVEVGWCGEDGQVAPLALPWVAGEPCVDSARDQVEVARADRDDDDRPGVLLASFGELTEEGGEGVDVVRNDDTAVGRGQSQHLVVCESRLLRFLVERAHVVAARGEPGADLWAGDVVVEQQPQRLPVQAAMNG